MSFDGVLGVFMEFGFGRSEIIFEINIDALMMVIFRRVLQGILKF